MNIARTVARVLLGALFIFAGASAFFVSNPPLQPGLTGTFTEVAYQSHFVLFVGAAQLTLGLLLIANRFVPVALIILAAFLYNSFAFHITMAQSGLFAPVIVLLLWLLIALPYRGAFAALFTAKPMTTPAVSG